MIYIHILIFLVMNLLLRVVFNFNLNSCARVTVLRTFAAAAKSLSRVLVCVTLWTAAHQAPLSTGFSRQEYWSGVAISFSDFRCCLGIIVLV